MVQPWELIVMHTHIDTYTTQILLPWPLTWKVIKSSFTLSSTCTWLACRRPKSLLRGNCLKCSKTCPNLHSTILKSQNILWLCQGFTRHEVFLKAFHALTLKECSFKFSLQNITFLCNIACFHHHGPFRRTRNLLKGKIWLELRLFMQKQALRFLVFSYQKKAWLNVLHSSTKPYLSKIFSYPVYLSTSCGK